MSIFSSKIERLTAKLYKAADRIAAMENKLTKQFRDKRVKIFCSEASYLLHRRATIKRVIITGADINAKEYAIEFELTNIEAKDGKRTLSRNYIVSSTNVEFEEELRLWKTWKNIWNIGRNLWVVPILAIIDEMEVE